MFWNLEIPGDIRTESLSIEFLTWHTSATAHNTVEMLSAVSVVSRVGVLLRYHSSVAANTAGFMKPGKHMLIVDLKLLRGGGN